jgi:hypothetical protein
VNGKVYVGTSNSVGIFGFVRQSMPPIADGPYVVTNANSLLVLDDPGSSGDSGVAIYQWAANGGLNQKWFFRLTGRVITAFRMLRASFSLRILGVGLRFPWSRILR